MKSVRYATNTEVTSLYNRYSLNSERELSKYPFGVIRRELVNDLVVQVLLPVFLVFAVRSSELEEVLTHDSEVLG